VLVVTTEGLPGYEVTAVLGEVLGVLPCSRNPFAAGVSSPDGGASPEMTRVLVHTRARAVAQMVHAAEGRGANAIVGMRFDHRDVTDHWVELCAYGTAVVAAPLPGRAAAKARSAPPPGHGPSAPAREGHLPAGPAAAAPTLPGNASERPAGASGERADDRTGRHYLADGG
jgi:uncharacterized protein YbjQ (UPF0145 family)